MYEKVSGQCQCGAIQYIALKRLPPAYACHCNECKKQSSSAFSISIPYKYSDLKVSGRTQFFTSQSYSNNIKYNYFCEQCGSRMWHSASNLPVNITLKAGTLHNSDKIIPMGHLWVSKKQEGILLDPESEQFETQPNDVNAWRIGLGQKN